MQKKVIKICLNILIIIMLLEIILVGSLSILEYLKFEITNIKNFSQSEFIWKQIDFIFIWTNVFTLMYLVFVIIYNVSTQENSYIKNKINYLIFLGIGFIIVILYFTSEFFQPGTKLLMQVKKEFLIWHVILLIFNTIISLSYIWMIYKYKKIYILKKQKEKEIKFDFSEKIKTNFQKTWNYLFVLVIISVISTFSYQIINKNAELNNIINIIMLLSWSLIFCCISKIILDNIKINLLKNVKIQISLIMFIGYLILILVILNNIFLNINSLSSKMEFKFILLLNSNLEIFFLKYNSIVFLQLIFAILIICYKNIILKKYLK